MIFYDLEGRPYSIDLSNGVSKEDESFIADMCDMNRFELICKEVLLSNCKKLLDDAIRELRVCAGCNACSHFKREIGAERTYHCELGGCNVPGKSDRFEWRGLGIGSLVGEEGSL